MSPGRTSTGPRSGGSHECDGRRRDIRALRLCLDDRPDYLVDLMALYHVSMDVETERDKENLSLFLEGLLNTGLVRGDCIHITET